MPAIFTGIVAFGIVLTAAVTARLVYQSLKVTADHRNVTGPTTGATEFRAATPVTVVPRRNLPLVVAVLIASAAYSWLASGTTPFTLWAEIACGVASVIVGHLAILKIVRMPKARDRHRTVASRALPGELLEPWILAVSLFIVWELSTYFAGFDGHRNEFPTLSVIANFISVWRPGKAVLFGLWLTLGWAIFKP